MPHYTTDQSINGIFMAIVGGALALGGKKPPKDDGKDRDAHDRDSNRSNDA